MSLTPEADKKIRRRFEELIKQCLELEPKMHSASNQKTAGRRRRRSGIISTTLPSVFAEEFKILQNRFLRLIQLLSTPSDKHLIQVFEAVTKLRSIVSGIESMKAYVQAISQDYNDGMLTSLSNMVEANITADYLGQAERLLTEGQPGKYDHVPAAVLTGAILEDGLRRLCDRNSISTTDAKGRPKTLNPMIDDLKKAGVFNELKAKQLRAWADVRNAAAHGEFTKFDKKDVEQMLTSVQNFLADYL